MKRYLFFIFFLTTMHIFSMYDSNTNQVFDTALIKELPDLVEERIFEFYCNRLERESIENLSVLRETTSGSKESGYREWPSLFSETHGSQFNNKCEIKQTADAIEVYLFGRSIYTYEKKIFDRASQSDGWDATWLRDGRLLIAHSWKAPDLKGTKKRCHSESFYITFEPTEAISGWVKNGLPLTKMFEFFDPENNEYYSKSAPRVFVLSLLSRLIGATHSHSVGLSGMERAAWLSLPGEVQMMLQKVIKKRKIPISEISCMHSLSLTDQPKAEAHILEHDSATDNQDLDEH